MDRRSLLERIERLAVAGDPASMRVAFERLADLPAAPFAGEQRIRLIGGVEVACFTPTTIAPSMRGAIVVYLHGGGYVFGSPDSHANLARIFATALGCEVMLPRYPLAPERRWPAQLDAALGVLAALRDEMPSQDAAPRLALAGDSAGGHLALCSALGVLRPECPGLAPGRPMTLAPRSGASTEPKPPVPLEAVAVFSPNTLRDYALSNTRRSHAALDPMNDPEQDDALARLAFGTVRGEEPMQTLTRATLDALPPLYIDVGTHEVLLDDSLSLAREAACQGVAVDLRVSRNGFHLRQLFAGHFRPADESLIACAHWLRRRLSRETPPSEIITADASISA